MFFFCWFCKCLFIVFMRWLSYMLGGERLYTLKAEKSIDKSLLTTILLYSSVCLSCPELFYIMQQSMKFTSEQSEGYITSFPGLPPRVYLAPHIYTLLHMHGCEIKSGQELQFQLRYINIHVVN